MKKIRASVCLALAAIVASGAAAVEINRIVLRVNNRILTLDEYQERRNERVSILQRREMAPAARQAALDKAGETVLTEAYEELLLLSRADQLSIDVSPRRLEEAIARQRESFGFDTDQEFEVALMQSGLTPELFEAQMRSNLILQELMSTEVRPRVSLEEEDLRRFYNENRDLFTVPEARRVREVIVLESSGLDDAELEATAEEIRARSMAGEDLAAAIVAYREREITSGAIELGWLEKGDLESSLDEAVWGLEAGQLSAPVRARGGIHLLEVLEVRERSVRGFRDVVTEIEERLGAQRMSEEMLSYVSELASRAYVVSSPPADAATFEPELPSAPLDPLDPLRGFEASASAVGPASEEPASEEPASEEPASEEPASEEPASEEPAVEERTSPDSTDDDATGDGGV